MNSIYKILFSLIFNNFFHFYFSFPFCDSLGIVCFVILFFGIEIEFFWVFQEIIGKMKNYLLVEEIFYKLKNGSGQNKSNAFGFN